MNFKAHEAAATGTDGGLTGSSSPEEPGGKYAKRALPPDCDAPDPDDLRLFRFLSIYYPLTDPADWIDWRWQMRNGVTTAAQLSRFMELTPSEAEALARLKGRLPLRITPWYLSLMTGRGAGHPLRRMMVPTLEELTTRPEEKSDSLNEEGSSPVPGLVHRYPDRVLFLVTQVCSAYCRYCTRSHSVGRLAHAPRLQWEQAIDYIAAHPGIRDVLISGGDPLTLTDTQLEYLLSRLRSIPHVEILRIGTKVPVVMPQRITPELTALLERFHPLWMSIHFSHPEEITRETAAACARLAGAGIPLGSQTVLLRDINDDPQVMRSLLHKLLQIRVRPYYLYQCDLVPGTHHFRTPVSHGLEIIRSLRGFTSGYAIPHFVIDAPGGGGKIPLLPEYVREITPEGIVMNNYLGETCFYPGF